MLHAQNRAASRNPIEGGEDQVYDPVAPFVGAALDTEFSRLTCELKFKLTHYQVVESIAKIFANNEGRAHNTHTI